MATNRILVQVRSSLNRPAVVSSFSDCLLKSLGHDDDSLEELLVHCALGQGALTLTRASRDSSSSAAAGDQNCPVPMQHFNECPMKMMTPAEVDLLPADVSSRGLNIGVVALLESADGRVLLTRRAKHMRTFPGVWVPPGGGIESGDADLLQTALRELREETGLDVGSEDTADSRLLCLWESVFPTRLSRGQPKRHHVVVYVHVTVKDKSCVDLNRAITLEPQEVDASLWLSRRHVELIMKGLDGKDEEEALADTKLLMKVLGNDGAIRDEDCPAKSLLARVPKHGVDVERMSSGTLFALAQWIRSDGRKSSRL